MTSLPRGLVVLGLVMALAGATQTAAAASPGIVHLADDDGTPVTTDDGTPVPTDDMIASPTDAPTATLTPTATATPTVTPTPIPTATPTVNPVVIQQVIQHSNDEQVQAVNTRNMSLMSDTLTADHFPDVANGIMDMLNHQVTAIEVLKLDFGPITVSVDGSSAMATTYETWRIISQAGSIDYDPVRNDYTLVLDNATWKIKSDVQVIPTPAPTGTGAAPP